MDFEKKLYGKREIFVKKNSFILEYYLTTMQGAKRPLYGIEIAKKQNNLVVESEAVNNISDCYNTVEVIIAKLFNYSVTPVTMLNILDDLGDAREEIHNTNRKIYKAC